ncbi:piggyBac transposable element-derived protein 3-like [Hyposmocoma kahamanoa]|uniref:piggyBac transposable element-derived protein 3-like n=1 Tax=Hyposmocoma kahamanoa TaxID=1477025 RepID=UPI000E6D8B1F|nr:piggyBac transposable element-derived protein 3-like [Hyposmocoma kahamanoa]
MSSNRPLSNNALIKVLENWSDIDSDDDDEPFVPSPQVAMTELPDDDLIDRRLDEIFGDSLQNADNDVCEVDITAVPEENNEVEICADITTANLSDNYTGAASRSSLDLTYLRPPTTPTEIKAFLGVMIMMGLHPLPDFELYWSSDRFYNNPDISSTFSLNRFKKLLENLHVNDNSTAAPRDSVNFDRLHKLRPLVEHLNVIFLQQAEESGIYSVDECMVKFKGRSCMKQYMPMKPIKRGYKVWARCDARSGYLYCFEIYTGKTDNKDEAGLGFTVVTNLCRNVPRDSLVTFDNFFTSCKLVDVLYQNGIFSTGTVRKTRKGLPEFMKEKPQDKKLKLAKNEFNAMTNPNDLSPLSPAHFLIGRPVTAPACDDLTEAALRS